jgi:superfamily II DNA or RNA helicase
LSEYLQFLEAKTPSARAVGFTVDRFMLNDLLKPWQTQLVTWALKLGRAAFFADCGLGKTFMQLEWASRVAEHTGNPVLILCPLAVAAQTVKEARRFGIRNVKYCTAQDQVMADTRIIVANYERLENFDNDVGGVVLDESSILKSFMGKTKRALVENFEHVTFKLACTATPSPNDVMELGNHCEFLGVMSSHEMLARFFINDTMAMGTYRLKAHAEADFWRWVCSWAASLASPADLLDANGKPYSNEGYVLPQLQLHEHVVEGPDAPPDEGQLVHVANLNATTMHAEMRRTAVARAQKAAELVAREPDEPWVLWCNTNYEADAIAAALTEAGVAAFDDLRGNQTLAMKETTLRAFSEGLSKVLLTKPSIAGFGLNWQHCARHAYVGLSYSFEQFYQALRRSYRFGQTREVHAHIIGAKSEAGIRASVARKQEDHRRLQARMVEVQRALQQADAEGIEQAVGPGQVDSYCDGVFELHHGDSVEVLPTIAANSVGLQVWSPPFANLYTYSASPRDLGNCGSYEEFFAHFAFMVPELLRITVPGRIACVHVKDLPRYRSSTGASGLRDFPGEMIRAMEEPTGPDGSRWVYHSKVTIWKDPVTEMQRTKSHGLLYKTLKADSSFSRQGCPDYLLMFRKWTPEVTSAAPVKHTPEDLPLEMWQRYASPVWFDVNQQRVLNVDVARAAEDEKHMCPLQLDVIERCVHLWSNPGDVVFSPFAGIGSEGFASLKLGRRFLGIELKGDYVKWARRNLEAATAQGEFELFPEERKAAANG